MSFRSFFNAATFQPASSNIWSILALAFSSGFTPQMYVFFLCFPNKTEENVEREAAEVIQNHGFVPQLRKNCASLNTGRSFGHLSFGQNRFGVVKIRHYII
ncbi:MAG: hypothetical protein IJP70_00825 [Bacteroidales bacterium]|nr:hypothetical protein [Bacteroidales bacterium]